MLEKFICIKLKSGNQHTSAHVFLKKSFHICAHILWLRTRLNSPTFKVRHKFGPNLLGGTYLILVFLSHPLALRAINYKMRSHAACPICVQPANWEPDAGHDISRGQISWKRTLRN